MRKNFLVLDVVWYQIISEFLVNLSVAWFGAVVIVANLSTAAKIDIRLLTLDIMFSIVSIIFAYKFRLLAKND